METLSFVIPALNEEQSLAQLADEISKQCQGMNSAPEIIFVDDGSSDGTWKLIERMSSEHEHISGIRLRKNFGKSYALDVGFAQASGNIIFMMDADLQDNPVDIPAFVNKITEGFDVVSGWRDAREDNWKKILQSRLFNSVVSKLTGVNLHDHNCGFKAYTKEAINGLRLYGEMHRFIPVLLAAKGFRVSEVLVTHRARVYGRSKYNFKRMLYGVMDLLTVYFLTSFKQRPMHFLGFLGLGMFSVGSLALTYLALLWVLEGSIGYRPLLFYGASLLIVGCQFFAFGILGELLAAGSNVANSGELVRKITSDKLLSVDRPKIHDAV